jgi:hypothetical protein
MQNIVHHPEKPAAIHTDLAAISYRVKTSTTRRDHVSGSLSFERLLDAAEEPAGISGYYHAA